MKRAVNVSPLPLMRDSRSLRYAHFLNRSGWRVTAVEMVASPGPIDVPFDVASFGPPREAGQTAPSDVVRQSLPWLWRWLGFLHFVLKTMIVLPIRGLFIIPAADVYVLHEYQMFPAVYLRVCVSGGAIIYDAHDFYPLVHRRSDVSTFWRRIFRPFLFWLECQCVRRACAVVTVNDGIAQLYRRVFGVDATVLRNVHDPMTETVPEMRLRQSLSVSKDDFLIVVIGNRKPGQCALEALQALLHLPDSVKLAFIGRGHDDLQVEARKLGVDHRVFIIGHVDSAQMVPFIREADAALVLYYARSGNDVHFLPNGFFHGIGAGLPTLYPNLRWVAGIGDAFGIGERIDPSNPRSIADGVLSLQNRLDTDDLREALLKAENDLVWEREAGVLLAELEKLGH